MKIQENLVWFKHTSDLIGFVELGDMNLNYATLQETNVIASHVLVFLLQNVVNPFKFGLVNFATKNATASQIFPLFWKAVAICETQCTTIKLLLLPVMGHLLIVNFSECTLD